MKNWQRIWCVLAVTGVMAACSSSGDVYVERPVEDLYNNAMDSLELEDWEDAVADFDEVERQHPYSVWATRAQLMSAYANYRADNYDEAILTANRFIELHPGHRDIGYAQYLIAISYYEQITDVGRDQAITANALVELEEIVRRYPTTEYARDARLKLQLARDHLAGKEMDIGRYYQGQRQYAAAINRFRTVVEDYQTSSQIEEALHRLVESYLALGVVREAQSAAAVLIHNYPESEWAQFSYAMMQGEDIDQSLLEDTWLSSFWRGVRESTSSLNPF